MYLFIYEIHSPEYFAFTNIIFTYLIYFYISVIYIYIYCLVDRVFASGPGDWSSVPFRLIPPCLALSIIMYIARVTWSNLGNGIAPIA